MNPEKPGKKLVRYDPPMGNEREKLEQIRMISGHIRSQERGYSYETLHYKENSIIPKLFGDIRACEPVEGVVISKLPIWMEPDIFVIFSKESTYTLRGRKEE